MRVLEASPASKPVMGKKKHKLRKKNRENEQCMSDSSDEARDPGMPGRSCPHLNKALNFTTLRKAMKQYGSITECSTCNQKQRADSSERAGRSSPIEGGAMSEEIEPTIWVCLQCGHLGCDRNSKDKHALKHYQTPRSASHSVALNVHMWMAWCYDCDDEVAIETSRRLTECVEFLRKQIEVAAPGPSHSLGRKSSISRADTSSPTIEAVGEASSLPKEDKANVVRKARPQTPMPNLPKVKGLSNLGNTCFFNAVMQNLSQTPMVESVISERAQKGSSVRLPGRMMYSSDSDSDDLSSEDEEGDKEEALELESMQIQLTESGPLTQSVLTFIRDMHSAAKNATISPSGLFGQVCRKAPRFKGFQQQDSHELLRHLLDGMKAEEIRRSQQGILKAFQLPENVNKKRVDDEMRAKLKGYGRQVKHTFVDSLFGGYFLSTVQCEECHTPSQIFEPFQDISLPITEEKPSRPNNLWSSRKKDTKPDLLADVGLECSGPAVDGRPTKYLSKKAKKQAKRDAKWKAKTGGKNKVGPTDQEDDDQAEAGGEDAGGEEAADTAEGKKAEVTGQPAGKEESQSNDEWESKSDADVEDNLESDVSRLSLASDVPLRPALAAAPSLVGGDEYHAGKRSSSELSMDCVSAPHPDLSSGSTTPKASTSDMQSLSSGLSTLTLENSASGDRLSSPAFIDEDPDVSRTDCRDVYDADISTIDCPTPRRENTDSAVDTAAAKPPKLSRMETQLHALCSLAPRYQSASHECSLMSCLNQFTAAELLTGNNKFGCRRCTKKKYGSQSSSEKKELVYTNASKQVLVFSPPAVLTLHLKRFQQLGFSLRKVNRHVEFPLVLDLAPYCSALCQGVKGGETKVLYSLYGVVEHSGRLTGGHYTAYVKVRPGSNKLQDFLQKNDLHSNQLKNVLAAIEQVRLNNAPSEAEEPEAIPPGKWYYISDSRVSEVNESNVLRCQAYLLFYERFH